MNATLSINRWAKYLRLLQKKCKFPKIFVYKPELENVLEGLKNVVHRGSMMKRSIYAEIRNNSNIQKCMLPFAEIVAVEILKSELNDTVAVGMVIHPHPLFLLKKQLLTAFSKHPSQFPEGFPFGMKIKLRLLSNGYIVGLYGCVYTPAE